SVCESVAVCRFGIGYAQDPLQREANAVSLPRFGRWPLALAAWNSAQAASSSGRPLRVHLPGKLAYRLKNTMPISVIEAPSVSAPREFDSTPVSNFCDRSGRLAHMQLQSYPDCR